MAENLARNHMAAKHPGLHFSRLPQFSSTVLKKGKTCSAEMKKMKKTIESFKETKSQVAVKVYIDGTADR